jgi:putative Mn2+ efflux pump MntP
MIGLGVYGVFLIVRAVVSPERADPNLTWARRGLPLPLSVDNIAAGTALGLAGYSPWLAPILFGVITFAVSIAGHQIGRTVAHFFDFIPRINTDLLTGIAFASIAVLMALGVTLPLSGD